jgi:Lhr-like helicase
VKSSRRSFLKGAGVALVGGTAVTVAAFRWQARTAEGYTDQPVDILAASLPYVEGERFHTRGYVEHVAQRDISVFETERNAIRDATVDLIDIHSPPRDATLPAFAYRNGMYSGPLPQDMTWTDAAGQVFSLYGRVERYADRETGYVGHRFELHDAYTR